MNYRLKRSNRKTIAIELTPEGLLVRAPHRASTSEIEALLHKHSRWIETHLQKQADQQAEARREGLLTRADIRRLSEQARKTIPLRVAHYAPQLGLDPSRIGRISIRCQKTRWGSCSSKGNLNFNCLLMLTPPEVIDSIVVHELCHLVEMNHSPRFYALVRQAFPEYDKWHRWLKDHGGAIMKRVQV